MFIFFVAPLSYAYKGSFYEKTRKYPKLEAVQPLFSENLGLLTHFQEPFPMDNSLEKILEEKESMESDPVLSADEAEQRTEMNQFLVLWNEWRHQAEDLFSKYPQMLFDSTIDFFELEKDHLLLESMEQHLIKGIQVLEPIVQKIEKYLEAQNIVWQEDDAPIFAQSKIMQEEDFKKMKELIKEYRHYQLEDPDFPTLLTSPENSDILSDFLILRSFLKTQQMLLKKIVPLIKQLKIVLQNGQSPKPLLEQFNSVCDENGCSSQNQIVSEEEKQTIMPYFSEPTPQYFDLKKERDENPKYFQKRFPMDNSLEKILEEKESMESDPVLSADESEQRTEMNQFLVLWNEWRHQAEELFSKYPQMLFDSTIDFFELEKDHLLLESMEQHLIKGIQVLEPIVQKIEKYLETQNIIWQEDDAPIFDQSKIMQEEDFKKMKELIKEYRHYQLEDPDFPTLLTSPENSDILSDFLILRSFLKTQQMLLKKIVPLIKQLKIALQNGQSPKPLLEQFNSVCDENGCSSQNQIVSEEEKQTIMPYFSEPTPQYFDLKKERDENPESTIEEHASQNNPENQIIEQEKTYLSEVSVPESTLIQKK